MSNLLNDVPPWLWIVVGLLLVFLLVGGVFLSISKGPKGWQLRLVAPGPLRAWRRR